MSRLTLPILVALVAAVLVAASGVLDSGGKSDPVRVISGVEGSGGGADSGGGRERGEGPHPRVTKPAKELPSVTGEAGPAKYTTLLPRRALGQLIVARYDGVNPPPVFLDRVKAGKIGGVILFEENLVGGDAAIERRIGRLQKAARRGGNPPLLVMVDQEGGPVRRLPGPPRFAPRSIGSAVEAHAAGEATGKLLRRLGINVDLAPVADVSHHGSFLESRSYSSSPATVADRACEFAAGLRSEGVAATLKHFPGLGMASVSTDESSVTIDASPGRLRADYAPYRACASQPLTLVMVDSAIYPQLTGSLPAVMSPLTYSRELPLAGVSAVTISDSLESPPIEAQTTPARRSIEAGLDLLLFAKSEAASAEAFQRLLADTHAGELEGRTISTAAARVVALKQQLTASE